MPPRMTQVGHTEVGMGKCVARGKEEMSRGLSEPRKRDGFGSAGLLGAQ